ncbi:aminopeptidase N [Fodinicola feengrottensis]|uniref:Aminopeptidase N n=1 Tax=Fodinicola feengrottensis TaxID=435914 RepID=A0ABN2IY78_9ACTN
MQARRRATLIAVESYAVELDLSGDDQTFTSTTVARFGCTAPGSAVFIDLAASAVRSIDLNGRPVPLSAWSGGHIRLGALAAHNTLRVVADCAYSRTAEGMHRFTDPADGSVYVYTHFQPAEAHRVYACFDQPDLKATFELGVVVPADWQVVANTQPDSVGKARLASGTGATRWHFPATPPLPTYATSVAAGRFHSVSGSWQRVPLSLYCRRSLAAYLDADELLEVTWNGFDFYQRLFGMPYPFGKYDLVFVPEFNHAGMENAACVTLTENMLFRSRVTDVRHERRASLLLHELAHMWFGNMVTMTWWDDLWLNESFATYASTLCQAEATRWPGAWTTFSQLFKTSAYHQDQLTRTHPIVADLPDVATAEVSFDGITYYKGASVLKQLVAYVGREAFTAGLQRYFQRHQWSTATLADLLAAVEATSGRDLGCWSKEWLQTAGVNTLRPDYRLAGDGTIDGFAVTQSAPEAHPLLRPHRIAVGLYDREGTTLTRRQRLEVDVAGDRTSIPALDGCRRPDLVLVNDDDLTYAKIRFDDRSLATVLAGAAHAANTLPAGVCWTAMWDMCRDGELPARDYVRLVAGTLDAIDDPGMLETLLLQTVAVARDYAAPSWRLTGLRQLADALHRMLVLAPAGSDRQLFCVQMLAGLATSDEHLTLLRELLEGATRLPGLRVDTELRWLLLRRLISRGASDESTIGEHLRRDRTAAGLRHAATCRAAIPTAAAKATTWRLLMAADGQQPPTSAAMVGASLTGFADLDQADLLEPYAQRYFDVIVAIWRDWPAGLARRFATAGYPTPVISEQTVAMTDECLSRDRPPPALSTILLERRDDQLRALRARSRDSRA